MSEEVLLVFLFYGGLYLCIGYVIGAVHDYTDYDIDMDFGKWVLHICMWPIVILIICITELIRMIVDVIRKIIRR